MLSAHVSTPRRIALSVYEVRVTCFRSERRGCRARRSGRGTSALPRRSSRLSPGTAFPRARLPANTKCPFPLRGPIFSSWRAKGKSGNTRTGNGRSSSIMGRNRSEIPMLPHGNPILKIEDRTRERGEIQKSCVFGSVCRCQQIDAAPQPLSSTTPNHQYYSSHPIKKGKPAPPPQKIFFTDQVPPGFFFPENRAPHK